MKKRSTSKNAWMQKHINDPFVRQARQLGYRSRASFKLLEIQNKDKLLKPGMCVVDLGSAPGGWSEVAVQHTSPTGQVIAIDLLPMQPIPHVNIMQGDFTDPTTYQQLLTLLRGKASCVDVVLSDLSPNLTGIRCVDQLRSITLAEAAYAFAIEVLAPQGAFLTKIFQGESFDDFLKMMRQTFQTTTIRKPKASKTHSKEIYLLGRGRR